MTNKPKITQVLTDSEPSPEGFLSEFEKDIQATKEKISGMSIIGYLVSVSYVDETGQSKVTLRINGDDDWVLQDVTQAMNSIYKQEERLRKHVGGKQ